MQHDELLVLDAEGSFYETLFIQEGSYAAHQNSKKYEEAAMWLADAYSSGGLWSHLVALLMERSFVMENGHWRLHEFLHAATRFFSAGFEDPRLTMLATSEKLWFEAVRAGTRGRHLHPVAATLMYIFATQAQPLPKRKASGPRHDNLNPPLPVLTEKRMAWERLIENSPGQSRSQLIEDKQGLATWLYRHDRDWYVDHQPPLRASRVGRTPEPIPACVSEAILGSTIDPRACPGGRPPLPSAYQMRIAYGMQEHAFHLLVSWTQAFGKAALLPGRKEIFVARRLEWAFRTYEVSSWSAVSVIAVKARIQPSTIYRFVPHLVA
jgi:hypothetical protein